MDDCAARLARFLADLAQPLVLLVRQANRQCVTHTIECNTSVAPRISCFLEFVFLGGSNPLATGSAVTAGAPTLTSDARQPNPLTALPIFAAGSDPCERNSARAATAGCKLVPR